MKAKAFVVVLGLLGSMSLVGCSASVDAVGDLIPKIDPAPSKRDVTLQIGDGSSALNNIQVGSEFQGGGTATLNVTPARSGRVTLQEAGFIAFDCDLSTVNPTYSLVANGQEVGPITLPADLTLEAGVPYTIRVAIPANTCSMISLDFFARWAN